MSPASFSLSIMLSWSSKHHLDPSFRTSCSFSSTCTFPSTTSCPSGVVFCFFGKYRRANSCSDSVRMVVCLHHSRKDFRCSYPSDVDVQATFRNSLKCLTWFRLSHLRIFIILFLCPVDGGSQHESNCISTRHCPIFRYQLKTRALHSHTAVIGPRTVGLVKPKQEHADRRPEELEIKWSNTASWLRWKRSMLVKCKRTLGQSRETHRTSTF